MASINIFRQDAFSTFEMTSAIERLPYVPEGLGALDVFSDMPIRTTALAVEERDGVLTVIPTSERGAPIPTERSTERRKVRYFEVPRIVQADTVTAAEIQNIRAFGQETELMQVQTEVARRLAGPTGLLTNIRYTHENMRLAAVQGLLLDADGSVVYNWFDEFQVETPDVVYFDLASNTPNTIRGICNSLIRSMYRSAKGAMPPGTRIVALCGDAFYDAFIQHTDVVRTFLNWSEAKDLRGGMGAAFDMFEFGGIEWTNYRGSDDNTTIKIGDDEVKFFPIAPGIFERALAPGETFDWVNTPGKEFYVINIPDRDRNAFVRFEAYSYPLFICKRPEVLRTGDIAASA
jgi:hypothetical protein